MTKRLLVVEDEGLIAKNIERLLSNEGYQVIDTPPSAEEALDQVEQNPPDLVLMDIQLAGEMTGIEAAEIIYQEYGIPIVYLTAHTDKETVERAETTEPFGFLSKPIDDDDLIGTVRMVIRKNEELKTERHEYESQIHLSEEHYDRLVQAIPDIVFEVDSEGYFRFISDSVRKLGYTPQELKGTHFETIIYFEDEEEFSNKEQLPEPGGVEPDEAGSPGFFDERGKGKRSSEMVVRVVSNHDQDEDRTHYFEVSSSRIYSESENSDHRDYIGSVGVMRDITQRKITEQELRETADSLQRSNRQLRQFADMAAHDLKAPLRTVVSFTELLREQWSGSLPGKARKYLDRVEEGTRTMDELVDGLREYAEVRLDQDRVDFVNLDELLDSVRRNLLTTFEEHDGSIERRDLHEVCADPVQLRRCLQNIIMNALEHGGEGTTTITVRSKERALDILVSVCDNGPGIPEKKFDEIFDSFTSGVTAEQDSEGRGLGLAICREIITQHGGEIWAEANEPRGTCFKFTLPKKGMIYDDIQR